MTRETRFPSFDMTGRVAVVTGGSGVVGGAAAEALAAAGTNVAILVRRHDAAQAKASAIADAGGTAIPLASDVLDRASLIAARQQLLDRWGRIDILVNAAGGNLAHARTDHSPPFDLPFDAFDDVVKLNLHGTVFPSLIFGEAMAERNNGSIVNISSMASLKAISGVPGYSVAKAGVDNFTRWLAVDLAKRFGAGMRVNSIAPGFFLSAQNRGVLLEPDGSYTARAKSIVEITPAGRFGEADELKGAVVWLCSDAASFVTGTVIPIDGGFQAASGL